MRHSIGAKRDHRVGAGLALRNSHHSPDRVYYKYRNYVLLVRSGTPSIDPCWAIRTALALIWGPLKVLASEDDKGPSSQRPSPECATACSAAVACAAGRGPRADEPSRNGRAQSPSGDRSDAQAQWRPCLLVRFGWAVVSGGALVSGGAAATATRSTRMTMPSVLLRNGLK